MTAETVVERIRGKMQMVRLREDQQVGGKVQILQFFTVIVTRQGVASGDGWFPRKIIALYARHLARMLCGYFGTTAGTLLACFLIVATTFAKENGCLWPLS